MPINFCRLLPQVSSATIMRIVYNNNGYETWGQLVTEGDVQDFSPNL